MTTKAIREALRGIYARGTADEVQQAQRAMAEVWAIAKAAVALDGCGIRQAWLGDAWFASGEELASLEAAADTLASIAKEAIEEVVMVPVAKIETEARRLIQDVLTSEAEVRAVATLADAVGANVDDLVPHEWIGRQP